MKNAYLLAGIVTLLLACNRDKDVVLSFETNGKIASIERSPAAYGIENPLIFRYDDQGQLKFIGNEELLYENGRLRASRYYRFDSVKSDYYGGYLYNLEIKKYTYSWQNDKVSEIGIDSIYYRNYTSGGTVREGLMRGGVWAKLYYNARPLPDSIFYLIKASESRYDQQKVVFSSSGENIVSKTELSITALPPSNGIPLDFLKLVERYKYDKRPGYLYALYKKLGVLPPSLGSDFIASKNNVSKKWNAVFAPGTTPTVPNDADYQDIYTEFDAKDRPVKVVVNQDQPGRSTIVVTYH